VLTTLGQAGRFTLHPALTRTYPLAASAAAPAGPDAGRIRGRAILVP